MLFITVHRLEDMYIYQQNKTVGLILGLPAVCQKLLVTRLFTTFPFFFNEKEREKM